MKEEIARLFCEREGYRKLLINPFNYNDHTYISNGHIIIRINKQPYAIIADDTKLAARIEDFINLPHSLEIKPGDFVDLPELNNKPECNTCHGKGKTNKIVKECFVCDGGGEVSFEDEAGNDYEFDCKECRGEGKIITKMDTEETCDSCNGCGIDIKNASADICDKRLSYSVLSLIKNLDNCKIAPSVVKVLEPIPIKFDGGIGIVMPMRKLEDA